MQIETVTLPGKVFSIGIFSTYKNYNMKGAVNGPIWY